MRLGTPKFRLTGCWAAVDEIRTRMPFRYGTATLTSAPVLIVKVQIESGARKRATGFAADCLPPRWFDKDPSKTFVRNVEDQLAAFRKARDTYLAEGQKLSTAADLWNATYPRILEEGTRDGLNALTCTFGSSFLERAVCDAICRLRGVSFFEALRNDLLGIKTSRDLPERPLESFHCRHTIGMGDPITVGEIPAAERVSDGLPQALEEDIEAYGLRYFKVKLSGNESRDVARISRLAVLLDQRCHGQAQVTLDGNEQYSDLRALERLFEALLLQPYGDRFLESVLFVEQPLPREVALAPEMAADVRRFSEVKPLVIDESDDVPDAFERAIRLGYRGVAHKNCKGIFKSLRNRALICKLNAEEDRPRFFQTGEDLATVPILPFQQDLASLAALDIDHVERNGHHYFRGLAHLPAEELAGAVAAHRDLYEAHGGQAFLRIQDGMIRAGSLQAPGYGYSCPILFEARTPLEEWTPERMAGS